MLLKFIILHHLAKLLLSMLKTVVQLNIKTMSFFQDFLLIESEVYLVLI